MVIISHFRIIKKNGSLPPLTYAIFNHVTKTMGRPNKPLDVPDFSGILNISGEYEEKYLLPSFEALGEDHVFNYQPQSL